MNSNPVDSKVDNSIACIFTMMLPGLGQMLKNQVIPGLIWAALVGGGYLIHGWAGLVLHVLCIVDAALYNAGSNSLMSSGWLRKGLMFSGLSLLLIYTCLRTALF